MQFVMHEVLKVTDELKVLPQHADIDADTINAVLEEGGKFAAEVTFPLNISGDAEGCTLDKATHEVTPPKGFKEAYAQVRRRRLGGAAPATPSTAARACPSWSTSASTR